MAKELLDIFIEQGYPYEFDLDFNEIDGDDLEDAYDCFFDNESTGNKQFSVFDNKYTLTLTKEDTGKIKTNNQQYVVYVIDKLTGNYAKLLSGRIVLEPQIRS